MRVSRLLSVLSLVLAACSVQVASPSPPTAVVACQARVNTGVLPTWARGGFSSQDPAVPHVVGRSGAIVAILFGEPLTSPPREGPTNKILWVARETVTAEELRIEAQRMDGAENVGAPVERTVAGGPGPSIIDLPQPGCWRLSLAWAGYQDSLDLQYVPRNG